MAGCGVLSARRLSTVKPNVTGCPACRRVRGSHQLCARANATALEAPKLYEAGGDPKQGQTSSVPREELVPLAVGELQAINRQRNTCFVEQFRIRGGEVGPDQVANAATMVNIMQETAGNHAVCLWGRSDKGFATAKEMEGLLLVMTRLSLRMKRYPKWGDRVECMTYWKVKGKIGAVREWTLTDAGTREVIGTATSNWLLINAETRRISRIPAAMLDTFVPYSPDEFLNMPFEPEKLGDIPAVDEAKATKQRQSVRVTDVDMNAHVNNAAYVAWVLSSIPAEAEQGGKRVAQLEVEYKQECRGDGGDIMCMTQAEDEIDGSLIFSLSDHIGAGGKSAEFARARCVLKDM